MLHFQIIEGLFATRPAVNGRRARHVEPYNAAIFENLKLSGRVPIE
jgi:hypothetical protein